MKTTVCLLVIFFAALSADAQTTEPTYTNPVARNLPDPFILCWHDEYFAYGTNSAGRGFKVRRSSDLTHWSEAKFCFERTASSWGKDRFWAPCVVQAGKRFFLFYSAGGPVGDHDSLRICQAVADDPAGPFKDLAAPFLDVDKAAIDAQVNVFNDGKAYLYYSLDISENGRSEICVVPLSADLLHVTGKPMKLTQPDGGWEGDAWNEGPFVFQHGRHYILMYSANFFADPNYAIGYAVADAPTGPFIKSKNNPVLRKTAAVSGPGHNCVIASPDGGELFCAYHIHQKLTGGDARDLAIDRMTVADLPDGSVRVHIEGPTRTPQPAPR